MAYQSVYYNQLVEGGTMSRSLFQVSPLRGSLVFLAMLIAGVCPSAPVSAQYAERIELPDVRGDLTLTVLGGLGGTAVAGAAVVGVYYGAGACDESDDDGTDCRMTRAVRVYVSAALAVPFLISAGVTLAGGATGGTGSYWSTFLGFAGLLPGIVLLSVAETPALLGLGVALLPIGYLTGAVIGYRWSADDPPQASGASIAVVPLRGGALLALGGGF